MFKEIGPNMFSNRLVFAALAVACVSAAGLGGYIATRQATESTYAAAGVSEHLDRGAGTPAPSSPGPSSEARADAEPSAPVAGGSTGPTDPVTPAEPARSARETGSARTEPARINGTGRAPRVLAARPSASVSASTSTLRRNGDRPTNTATDTVSPQVAAPAAVELPPATDAPNTTLEPVAVLDAGPATPSSEVASRAPELEELLVSADSVIGLYLQRGLSSETARVEDDLEARVVRDVRVGRRVAIPAGSRALGSVTLVERGGRLKERACLGIRFHTLVLSDGSRLPITTDTIYRYGDAPGDKSAKKIGGGAVAGAILGAIIGGAKGAAVGATAGAGGGTAMVMAGERSAAEFPSGSDVTARILSPLTVAVER